MRSTPIPTPSSNGSEVCLCSDCTSKPEERAMSSALLHSEPATEAPKTRTVETKLEVIFIPVSDVDRAKRVYADVGCRLDVDFVVGDAFRAVQFTPPTSNCSIHFGMGITPALPGSARLGSARRAAPVSCRLRRRGRARPARCARCPGERGVSSSRAGRAARRRSRSATSQLQRGQGAPSTRRSALCRLFTGDTIVK